MIALRMIVLQEQIKLFIYPKQKTLYLQNNNLKQKIWTLPLPPQQPPQNLHFLFQFGKFWVGFYREIFRVMGNEIRQQIVIQCHRKFPDDPKLQRGLLIIRVHRAGGNAQPSCRFWRRYMQLTELRTDKLPNMRVRMRAGVQISV